MCVHVLLGRAWGSPTLKWSTACLSAYHIYRTLCCILFDATKMAAVGELSGLFAAENFTTWWTLETTTTCRSLLYTTSTETTLRWTVSNTTASEPSENRIHLAYATLTYIRIWRGFAQGSVLKYILVTSASTIYALFVLNTEETRNQYCASYYGSPAGYL